MRNRTSRLGLLLILENLLLRNRESSQMVGREELFERERHQEPVAGWHACVLACAELEEAS